MIVYSERYLEHNQEYHPENNRRLKAVMSLMTKRDVFEKVPLVEPTPAKEEDIQKIHTKEHFELVKKMSHAGGMMNADTYVTGKTFETAMLAAGGVLTCIDNRKYKHSFALIRPPGHHASQDRSMGFCIFNNIAVGAVYAMEKYKLKRILILDYDIHHGNGTQEIFYSDPKVLYISLHQYPLYPGTGSVQEIGEGEGKGYTINIPLPQNTCDSSYLKTFDEIVMPVISQFRPELILVSAGYDAHYTDPLGNMQLSSNCYSEIAKRLKQNECRTVFGLEGGYNLTALANCVYSTIATLFDLEVYNERPVKENESVTAYVNSKISVIKKMLSNYWSF